MVIASLLSCILATPLEFSSRRSGLLRLQKRAPSIKSHSSKEEKTQLKDAFLDAIKISQSVVSMSSSDPKTFDAILEKYFDKADGPAVVGVSFHEF